MSLYSFTSSDDPSEAKVTVDVSHTSDVPVSKYITGKFCEHLFTNIYKGMHANVLMNPAFGAWPFAKGMHPDGGINKDADAEQIAKGIRARCERMGLPDAEKMVQAYEDALAHWWIKEGKREDITTSSDGAPSGTRAQRVEVNNPGLGIAQWTHLPLHRIRDFEISLFLRSPELNRLRIVVFSEKEVHPICETEITGISAEWGIATGEISIPEEHKADAPYRIALLADEDGQFVISRFEIYPADHIHGCDPDIINLLKDSGLPVLRWPGGNFVSGYHWKDGVGPVHLRPTRDNCAWSNIEYNLFGTDEYIQYCRDIGCEPMICVNAGDGTPEEAADWVEYCNGSVDTPMGKLRAENGHPEPYDVKFWEIGNELYGQWQKGWTTPEGYADRYDRFYDAMIAKDDSIILMANGGPTYWKSEGSGEPWPEERGKDWNRALCRKNAEKLGWITDHRLDGGKLSPSSDPLDIYRDCMNLPDHYAKVYRDIEELMKKLGVEKPRMAITEMQLFGGLAEPAEGEEVRTTPETLVKPDTMAEAVWATLWYQNALRHQPFLSMITHSATVNHGGGLRKQKEQVFANPVFHARAMFNALCGGKPTPVSITSHQEMAAGICAIDPKGHPIPAIGAAAVVLDDGTVAVSIVNRGTESPVKLQLECGGSEISGEAEVTQLSSKHPWDKNTFEDQELIKPREFTVPVKDGKAEIDIPLFSVTVLQIKL